MYWTFAVLYIILIDTFRVVINVKTKISVGSTLVITSFKFLEIDSDFKFWENLPFEIGFICFENLNFEIVDFQWNNS